jgi:inner membrane protein
VGESNVPTVFTHALVGGAMAQVAPRDFSRWKVLVALVFVAIVPDLDVIAFSLGIPYAHPLGHRGFSHSLLFAGVLSALVCLVLFYRPSRFSKRWWWFFGITFLAAMSHGLLDAATDAGKGIGLLIPFSEKRFFFEFRPIRTATVNPLAFFQKRSLAILWSEVVWVWLPLLSLSVVYQIGRYLHYWGSKKAFTQRS